MEGETVGGGKKEKKGGKKTTYTTFSTALDSAFDLLHLSGAAVQIKYKNNSH